MIIVSRGALSEIGGAIVSALMGATDHHGRQYIQTTIDPAHLENIALGALAAASGQTVWKPGEVIEKGPEEPLPFIRTVYPRT